MWMTDGEKTGTTTTTVMFLGGMAMASDSNAGRVKLAVSNDDVDHYNCWIVGGGLYHN